jgi:hypothetical protein
VVAVGVPCDFANRLRIGEARHFLPVLDIVDLQTLPLSLLRDVADVGLVDATNAEMGVAYVAATLHHAHDDRQGLSAAGSSD